MNKSFAFKLLIIFWTWIKTAAIFFPFCYLFVSVKQGKLKYGYDFFEVDYRWALMIAIGIAMAFVVWTAMEFTKLNFNDLKQYLKSKQKHYYRLSSNSGIEEVQSALSQFANSQKRWKFTSQLDQGTLVKSNPYFIKDRMTIKIIDGALEIESQPVGLAWLLDIGRNYKHILRLGDYLKERGL